MNTTETGTKAAGLGEALPGIDLASLKARAVAAGFKLDAFELPGQPVAYFVSRWGMSKDLPDLVAVVRFLDRVEGKR